MIVSHKHKFIFVKTHKTATQSFFNVIRPHLGPDDVAVGDERVADDTYNLNKPNDQWRFVDTSLNIDQKFPTGLSARETKDKMGNHIPWFTIKKIVGDDIWNTYSKFSIERDPLDRIVSLFYFLEKRFVHPLGGVRVNPDSKMLAGVNFSINEKHDTVAAVGAGNPNNPRDPKFLVYKNKEISPVDIDPDGVRSYFEDWVLCQLMCKKLSLVDEDTYSNTVVDKEHNLYRNTCKKHKLKTLFMEDKSRIKLSVNNRHWMTCPSLIQDILISDRDYHNPTTKNSYHRYLSLEGQCRFLNYGYYHDGDRLQIDHLVKYNKDLAGGFNEFFKKYNIDVRLTSDDFNKRSLNINHRKTLKNTKSVDWWFSGPRGETIKKEITREFKHNI